MLYGWESSKEQERNNVKILLRSLNSHAGLIPKSYHSYKLCEMTLFPDRLHCPIFPSESLLFDDQKDAEKLDNCDCKIWHQITAAELKKHRLAMFFGRTRLASTVHM